jgi:hypothetical protein
MLPIEILFIIISMLDMRDIITLMKVNKFFYDIINQKETIFCLSKQFKLKRTQSIKNLLTLYHSKYISINSLDYMSKNKCLLRSCTTGNIKMVKYLLDQYKFSRKKLDFCVSRAARKNQKNVVDYFIENDLPKDFNRIMANACFGGNTEIVNKMLELGADEYNYCAWAAARNNHREIIYHMLSLGADNYLDIACGAARGGNLDLLNIFMDFSNIENLNIAMFNAVYGGNLDIVEYLISKGANDFNRGLIASSKIGNLDITNLMLKNNANNYHIAFRVALNYGKLNILKILPELDIENYNNAIIRAIAGNKSLEIISFIFNKGVNNYKYMMYLASFIGSMRIVKFLIGRISEYNEGLKGASKGGFINIVRLMLKLNADNFNESMVDASNIKIVKILIKKGADNYEDTMESASRKGYLDIIKLMVKKGAKNFTTCLYNACKFNHLDIVKFLAENVSDDDLNYALMIASQEGHYNIVRYLVSIGADKYYLAIITASFPIIPTLQHYKIIKFLRYLNDLEQSKFK